MVKVSSSTRTRVMFWPSVVFFFQAEDGIRDVAVTGVQTCALPIASRKSVVASRDPLSARPGALHHGRRRGGLRDRCAAGHAGSGGPGGPGGTRAGRLFGAPAPRSAGGGSGGARPPAPSPARAPPR